MDDLIATKLERCPAELFGEIFRYLNGLDVYRAFYGLNERLSALVRTHGVKYLDLSETSFYDCKKILSHIDCFEVNTLILSDQYYDEQIERILSRNLFPLDRFQSLRSVTLDSLGLFTFNIISSQDFLFSHLESLIIRFRPGLCDEKLAAVYQFLIYDFVHRFKSLKVFDLSFGDSQKSATEIPSRSTTSSMGQYLSLKSLSINHLCIKNIENVLAQFPNLTRLDAIICHNDSSFDYPLLSNLTFCYLKIFSYQFPKLLSLLKQCPNLKQLTININCEGNELLDSEEFENLIETYLPNLKQLCIISYIPVDVLQSMITEEFSQKEFWLKRHTKVTVADEESAVHEDPAVEIMVEFAF